MSRAAAPTDAAQALRAALPSTADSAVPAAFLPYQQRWVADDSAFKVAEKSRRTGLTWAEAGDDVLIAGAGGGMNVYYIGYNMDMAIEYIEACAMWARVFDQAASAIEEGEELFRDGQADKAIKTYTIRFASGFRIVALSSRPANLRGKQGVVVIDEAAFHNDLDELLKAAIALLMWGGKVRVISTHNGTDNPFNQLIEDIRAGKRSGSIHRIGFQEALAEGLYQRVCLRQGKPWSQQAQDEWAAAIRKTYGDAAEEELDVVPSQGSGAWLSGVLIEARMVAAPVLRYACPAGFEKEPDWARAQAIQNWLDEDVAPHLAALDPELESVLGEDFGRSGDLTVIAPAQIGTDLTRRVPCVLELRNTAYDRAWASALVQRAGERLRAEFEKAGKAAHFTVIFPRLNKESDGHRMAEVAAKLGITESAAKMIALRMRRRYAAALREEVAATVGNPEDGQDELSYLLGCFA